MPFCPSLYFFFPLSFFVEKLETCFSFFFFFFVQMRGFKCSVSLSPLQCFLPQIPWPPTRCACVRHGTAGARGAHSSACSLGEREERGRGQPAARPEFFIISVAGAFEDCFLKKTANFFFI
uniref:Uncharacterized protein n=1 Tax=Pipistrellus kuhlii TaxID=59472 RepID=A0A7J7SUN4_PIPKU|nr:hypothetical protein mPipKuh1_009767 [Pipistrellus kuhlii]